MVSRECRLVQVRAHRLGTAPDAPRAIQVGSSQDGEKPGACGGRLPQSAVRIERAERGFLEQVLRVRLVAPGEPECRAE